MDSSIHRHEVVISGISGTFPYSDSVDELRDNLFNKATLTSSDDCRWRTTGNLKVPNSTGKIHNAMKFDAAHFGIHKKLTEVMDPMMYYTLEKTYEAIMDAGVNPHTLKGSNTSVVMASVVSEADNVYDYEAGEGFGILGHNRSMLACRVSYYLDIKGPSYITLGSWPEGLTALSIAYKNVSTGRSNAAIIGTSSLCLFPQLSWLYDKMGLLSPDGITRSFDASGNGYGRSEATVVLFLQRKQDAKRIYAEILHTDVCCYGDRKNFLSPTQEIITNHLKKFYDSSKIDPTQVQYLEADGSAAKDNDRRELNAITEVMLQNRKSPLLVGSVMSNLGHTGNSSSMCALIKVLIAMESGYIPPNMNYNTPVPGVPALKEGKLKVVTDKVPWKGGLAAINSLGVDGSCGHTVLKSFTKEKSEISDKLPRLVCISSRTEEGLHKILTKIESMPPDPEFIRLLHDIHNINIPTHLYRGYTIVGSESNSVKDVQHLDGAKRPVWFIFSGMGSQWPGMAVHLLKLPVFAEAIDRCHACLKPKGLDLKKIITDKDPHMFDCILHSFVGIAAVQIGLVALLQKLGITPDGIIGHSVGELGCSLADGCFTEEDMILCAYSRGMASLESNVGLGMMAAVGMGYEKLKSMVPPNIDIACHNGPDSCTISGPTIDVTNFVEELTKKGIFARLVNSSNIAYHSRYIAPIGPRLLKYLKEVIQNPKQRSSRWVSTSVPEKDWELRNTQFSSPEYHTNNLLSSVLFEEGCRHIPSNAICIEISPHGLLQAILRRSLDPGCTNICLTQRGHERGLEFLFQSIGKMFMLGLQPKLSEIFPPVSFPVSRGTPSISPLIEWEHAADWSMITYLKNMLIPGESTVQLSLAQGDCRSYGGHILGGHVILPATAHLKFAWSVLTSIMEKNPLEMSAIFQNVIFHQPVIIPKKESVDLYLMLQRGTGMFEILVNNELVTSGQVSVPEDVDKEFTQGIPEPSSSWTEFQKEELYKEFENRGYKYDGVFKAITSAKLSDTCSVGKIKWCDNWVAFTDCMLQLATLKAYEKSQDLRYPTFLRRLVVDMNFQEMKWGQELEATANSITGIVRSKGIEIHGLQTKPLDFAPEQNINFQFYKQKFVMHQQLEFKSVDNFIEASIQLAVENFHPSNKNKSLVSIAELKNKNSLITSMENVVKTLQNTSVELNVIDWPNEREVKKNCVLVLANEALAQAGAMLIADSGAFLLVRVANSAIWQPCPGLVVILEQVCEGFRHLLLRKETPVETTATTIAMHNDRAVWLGQLRTALRRNSRVYLVSHSEPPCGIPNFLASLPQDCKAENIRCIFILDRSAPPFSLEHEVYRRQLTLDLSVNVYQKGGWGTYCSSLLNEKTEVKNWTPRAHISLEGMDIHYAAPAALIPDEDGQEKGLAQQTVIEFSGIDNKSDRVMGLALSESSKTTQHLIWSVPQNWSLEEAATVPEAYALAYYALKLIGNVRSKDKVLIQSGHTVKSQAAITVALSLGATVYTLVDLEHRQFFKERFPQINDNQIFDPRSSMFESQLLEATNGKGVALVISDKTDEKLHPSLRCLKIFGHIIHIGRENLTKAHHLGMSVFLKSISFHGVSTEKLVNISEKWQQQLHAAVQEGITNGVVKPLERVVCSYCTEDEAKKLLTGTSPFKKILLDMRTKETKDVDSHKRVLKCNPNNSYLIFGGKGDDWLNLAGWLVKQGARKLVIAQQGHPVTSYFARRLGLLRSVHGVDIALLPAHMASSPQGASSLIDKSNTSGPLAGIFILPLQSREWDDSILHSINNLDIASRNCPLQYFVSLRCQGVERVFETRNQLGLPALAVLDGFHSKHLTGIQTILHQMQTLLTTSEPVIIFNAIPKKMASVCDNQALDRLNSLVPASLRDLVDLGTSLTEESLVEEVATLSPGLAFVNDIPPLFFLPSLRSSSATELKPLLNKLLYPAFLLKIGQETASLQESATRLVQHMKKIYPSGPYVLVGDLSGGAVALEIAGLLEAQGHHTQVFLLDGVPESLQKTLTQLGKESELEVNLLGNLFHISSDKVKENLFNLPNWDSRLSAVLDGVLFEDTKERNLTIVAANAIYSHIRNLLLYKPTHEIRGPVTVIVPITSKEDVGSLLKICEHTAIYLIGEDHKAMIASSETSNIINTNFIIE